jgi:hypothetical protein
MRDLGRTTNVLHLAITPIALAPVGVQIRLAPITLDIDAIPSEGDRLATLLPQL